MEDNSSQHLAVFHKHVKDKRIRNINNAPRVSVPVGDIRTISESHMDGTTLVRTSDGGTIAVEETFDEANKIWKEA